MNIALDDKPLTDEELDRLGEFLDRFGDGRAMNLEELDGFFSALIAGPELVPPSEYLPQIFRGEPMKDAKSMEEASEALALLFRHWNSIADTLAKGDFHIPVLVKYKNEDDEEDGDEEEIAGGNDWASGFMTGVSMRFDAWGVLDEDKETRDWLLPMLYLDQEHDPDPESRPPALPPEQRTEVVVAMMVSLLMIYRYFRSRRQTATPDFSDGPRRTAPKVGRNERCPCGSGKKYKRCCGA